MIYNIHTIQIKDRGHGTSSRSFCIYHNKSTVQTCRRSKYNTWVTKRGVPWCRVPKRSIARCPDMYKATTENLPTYTNIRYKSRRENREYFFLASVTSYTVFFLFYNYYIMVEFCSQKKVHVSCRQTIWDIASHGHQTVLWSLSKCC